MKRKLTNFHSPVDRRRTRDYSVIGFKIVESSDFISNAGKRKGKGRNNKTKDWRLIFDCNGINWQRTGIPPSSIQSLLLRSMDMDCSICIYDCILISDCCFLGENDVFFSWIHNSLVGESKQNRERSGKGASRVQLFMVRLFSAGQKDGVWLLVDNKLGS